MHMKTQSARYRTYYHNAESAAEAELYEQRRRLKSSHATPELLDLYCSDPDLATRIIVARHANTSLDTLKKMVRDENDKVCNIIALRPEATADMLHNLVKHSDSVFVWRNAARHANTSAVTLEILAKKDDRTVLFGMLKNRNTPRDTIALFIEHEDVSLRKTAQKRLAEPVEPVATAVRKTAVKKQPMETSVTRGSVFVT